MPKRIKQTSKLSRKAKQRQMMLDQLANSLFFHQEVVTTRAKAKPLVRRAEKLITLAKKDTQSSHRRLEAMLEQFALEELLEVIAPRFKNRESGYLSLSDAGWRQGDNAQLVRVAILADDLDKPQETTGSKPADNINAQTQTEEE